MHQHIQWTTFLVILFIQTACNHTITACDDPDCTPELCLNPNYKTTEAKQQDEQNTKMIRRRLAGKNCKEREKLNDLLLLCKRHDIKPELLIITLVEAMDEVRIRYTNRRNEEKELGLMPGEKSLQELKKTKEPLITLLYEGYSKKTSKERLEYRIGKEKERLKKILTIAIKEKKILKDPNLLEIQNPKAYKRLCDLFPEEFEREDNASDFSDSSNSVDTTEKHSN